MRSPLQHLADLAVGQPVEDYIAARRAAGITLRAIAREIAEASGGRVDPTERTLRNWIESATATPTATPDRR